MDRFWCYNFSVRGPQYGLGVPEALKERLTNATEKLPQCLWSMLVVASEWDPQVDKLWLAIGCDNQHKGLLASGAAEAISVDATSDVLDLTLLRLSKRLPRIISHDAKGSELGMIGNSESMMEVYSSIKKFAPHDATVLVQGESGTGKELVALALHKLSNRSKGPFVAVNCGAIPENLLESELFGHKKGAFTDASKDKAGLFKEADGGTIFLDEIAELPLQLQSKMLRVLQEHEVRPLGGTASEKVDVRVVAATLKDLEGEVANKRFREDLFYRLNVLQVLLPALKDRDSDITLLAQHFVKVSSERLGVPAVTLGSEALEVLEKHDWPGNVRELQNTIERSVVLADGPVIDTLMIGSSPKRPKNGPPPLTSLKMLEEVEKYKQYVLAQALLQSGGDRVKAMKLLGVSTEKMELLMKKREENG